MAHLVEQMAYVGRTPWHGLGNQLTEHQPLEVWAEQAGMDWQIKQTPVRFMAGQQEHLGQITDFPDKKVLYRSDTLAALSVVSQRYHVVQPQEILEFYRDLTEVNGFELETAGVLKEGRKLWALARTGQSSALKGNDVSNGYLLLATACDGSMATTAQFTSIRVVCNNTLAVALAGSAHCVKVPHSTVFDPTTVKQQLGISVSIWDEFMYRMKLLSECKVKAVDAQRYFTEVFSDPSKPIAEKAHKRAITQTLDLFGGRGKGSELASANGTAYGLLNAVTEFVDHERRARSVDNRLDSAWFGQGSTLKQRALTRALRLVA